jgi:hypothetical protein
MGGYELIYPCSDRQTNLNFEKLLAKSNEIYDDFTKGKKRHLNPIQEK